MRGTRGVALAWDQPDGVRVRYSPAAAGRMKEPGPRRAFIARVGCPHPCAVNRQVHGARVVRVDRGHDPATPADGMVTARADLALGVFGADCPGLLIDAGDVLAAGHCGWRGVAAGIVDELCAAVARLSAVQPGDWRALIGPGICGSCYEVGPPVVAARSWPRASLRPGGRDRFRLDLAAAISADLHARGVVDILSTGVCTAERPDLNSYRRTGSKQAQLLLAWRDPVPGADR